MIELINDDCMNIMSSYDDQDFDLAIIDPPYRDAKDNDPNQWMRAHSDDRMANFGDKPTDEYFQELFRISKNQIIWGGNYFPYLWSKECKGFIFWYKHQKLPTFSDGEMAWTSFNKVARCFDYMYIGGAVKGKYEEKIHPTQKPVDLYKWLLHNYAEPGQKILDTHLGSGSIGIACHYFEADLVGIELDPVVYKKAKARIDEQTRQETLF